jgi:hypothetical protein
MRDVAEPVLMMKTPAGKMDFQEIPVDVLLEMSKKEISERKEKNPKR